MNSSNSTTSGRRSPWRPSGGLQGPSHPFRGGPGGPLSAPGLPVRRGCARARLQAAPHSPLESLDFAGQERLHAAEPLVVLVLLYLQGLDLSLAGVHLRREGGHVHLARRGRSEKILQVLDRRPHPPQPVVQISLHFGELGPVRHGRELLLPWFLSDILFLRESSLRRRCLST